ncbi:hypothetical protein PHMEG_00034822 [Phytophthora megakarya]|uniref:Cas12f1-like TNB domain-containing protein n=1 Tax=Phytophthora megakarya TaxID=4795 RepID=A0A225UQI0_9STRA|nr:hypothetical protein PHMEG_00034822 [Phytophthora megakarya]
MLEPQDFSKLTAESAFFMCPSRSEGYGHYINQTRASGGVANSFVLLVRYNSHGLCTAVRDFISSTTSEQRTAMGARARQQYHEDTKFFARSMQEQLEFTRSFIVTFTTRSLRMEPSKVASCMFVSSLTVLRSLLSLPRTSFLSADPGARKFNRPSTEPPLHVAVNDMHQKLSSWLAANYKQVLLLSFHTSEMAHYRFKMHLTYTLERAGERLVESEDEYTSKTCSGCGAIKTTSAGARSFGAAAVELCSTET